MIKIIYISLVLWPATLLAQDSLIYKSIYFGGGSYGIDDQQIKELNEFIRSIQDLQNFEIIIFSHTDNIGGQKYNKWLSRMRSETVSRNLTEMGIPEEMIEIRDFGQENPLYTNKLHQGRMRNRRADVILWPLVL